MAVAKARKSRPKVKAHQSKKQQRFAALKQENKKLHARIVELETESFSLKNRVVAYQKRIKQIEHIDAPVAVNFILPPKPRNHRVDRDAEKFARHAKR